MLRALLLPLAAIALAGCSRKPPADETERLCATACSVVVASPCPSAAADPKNCTRACEGERNQAARAGCSAEYAAFLGCVIGAARCRPGDSVRDVFAAGIGVEPCQDRFRAYSRCALSCREHGVVRMGTGPVRDGGDEHVVQAELTTRGCGQALPERARAAPPGARCEHHSVCTAVDCPCPHTSEGYRVRACVDATCADAAAACRLGPLAVGHAVCRP
ncbi:MAG: hypothetical protein ACOY0T_25650 [Myxococcota bacterium]